MARPPAHSTYARYVGEIAVGWNQIERETNNLIFQLMGGDSHVAGFILGAMGNQTKAEFLKFLVGRSTVHDEIKDGILYAITLINRIRENRNIVEHGVPVLYRDGTYTGELVKLDKSSNFRAFEAPIAAVKEMAQIAKQTSGWLRMIRVSIEFDKDPKHHEPNPHGMTTAEATRLWLSSRERPPLPHKIDPLELEEARIAGPRPPRPSQA